MIASAASQPRPTAADTWDHAHELLMSRNVQDGMDLISNTLEEIRGRESVKEWHRAIEAYRRHPVFTAVQQAPLTRRAMLKPRGYPGDAVTLDYIYGMAPCPDRTTRMGAALYAWEYETLACRAVRSRMETVATVLNDLIQERENPRALAVACGHLREASRLTGWGNGAGGELIAMDQDPLSISVVARTYGCLGVVPICRDVRSIVRGAPCNNLDLVYSTGLYDYLSQRWATALTTGLFNMLGPGGRLLLANFTDFPTAGYLEGSMSWWLTYRNASDMEELTDRIPAAEVAERRTYYDKTETIVFLEVTKA